MELGQRFRLTPTKCCQSCARADVTLCGGWFHGSLATESLEANKERIQPMIELLKLLMHPASSTGEGARSIQGEQGTPLAKKPVLSDEDMAAYARKITAFGEWAAEQGMPLSYHHHMGAVVQFEHEIDAFVANSGAGIPLLFDAGHLAFAGGDPLGVIDKHHARISHVHTKDIRQGLSMRLI